MLGFALLCTAGVVVLVGLLPAPHTLRAMPRAALASGGRAAGGRRSTVLRQWMIGAQVLAYTALLLLTALFSKSLLQLTHGSLGFSGDHIVMAQLRMLGNEYDATRRSASDDAVLGKLRTLPGASGAALVSSILNDGPMWLDFIHAEGSRNDAQVEFRWISPGYFSTLQQRLISGRDLTEGDRNAKVAVLSESAAKAAWPGLNPLGRHFKHGDNHAEYTVVGVVADVQVCAADGW